MPRHYSPATHPTWQGDIRRGTTRITDVLSKLSGGGEIIEEHDGWLVPCLAHGDANPSLKVFHKEDGRITFTCRSHDCDYGSILDASGLSAEDLLNGSGGAKPAQAQTLGPEHLAPLRLYLDTASARYPSSPAADYAATRFGITEESGQALGLGFDPGGTTAALQWRTARYSKYQRLVVPFYGWDGVARGLQGRDLSGECTSRWIGLASPEGAKWSALAVFRLPDSYAATVVTEGPGDALTAVAAGYTAVALRGASLAGKKAVAEEIHASTQATIYLAGDADKAGDGFNRKLYDNLTDLGADVRILQLPPDSSDLADWREKRPAEFAAELHTAIKAARPWGASDDAPEPYTGDPANLLDRIRVALQRFVFLKNPAWYDAVTLWIASTYLIRTTPVATIAPRLGFMSSVPGSGKSIAMEMVIRLASGKSTTGATGPAILRVQSGQAGSDLTYREPPVPIALDEVDQIYTSRAADNGDFTSILNTGYRSGACVVKADKENQKRVVEYPCFGPVAWAGLSKAAMPEALLTRSLVIEMDRARGDERTESYIELFHGDQVKELVTELMAWSRYTVWSHDVRRALVNVTGRLVDILDGRGAELWSAILLPAELAGGDWPERAMQACTALKDEGRDNTETPSQRFLTATYAIYCAVRDGKRHPGMTDTAITRQSLIEHVMEADSLFASWGRDGITDEQARRMLRDFGIRTAAVFVGGKTSRGYRWADFCDPWARYTTGNITP
jgi:hypothetical protein